MPMPWFLPKMPWRLSDKLLQGPDKALPRRLKPSRNRPRQQPPRASRAPRHIPPAQSPVKALQQHVKVQPLPEDRRSKQPRQTPDREPTPPRATAQAPPMQPIGSVKPQPVGSAPLLPVKPRALPEMPPGNPLPPRAKRRGPQALPPLHRKPLRVQGCRLPPMYRSLPVRLQKATSPW